MTDDAQELRRSFQNPPEGIAPGSELDVRRFLRLGFFGKMFFGALMEHREVPSITEAIRQAEEAQEGLEDFQRAR